MTIDSNEIWPFWTITPDLNSTKHLPMTCSLITFARAEMVLSGKTSELLRAYPHILWPHVHKVFPLAIIDDNDNNNTIDYRVPFQLTPVRRERGRAAIKDNEDLSALENLWWLFFSSLIFDVLFKWHSLFLLSYLLSLGWKVALMTAVGQRDSFVPNDTVLCSLHNVFKSYSPRKMFTERNKND